MIKKFETYIKESLNIFKRGDHVMINGMCQMRWNHTRLPERLRFTDFIGPDKSRKIIGIITKIRDHTIIVHGDNDYYLVEDKFVWLLDDTETAKRGMEWAIKNKDMKEKTKDIDPYGEEEWND